MADLKDKIFEDKTRDLKRADSKKTQVDSSQISSARNEILSGRKFKEKTLGANVKVKKRLPIAVDIIAGILMLVLVCAIIAGSYVLFRYYSNDYDGVNVTYTIAFNVQEDINQYNAMKNQELFMDKTSNSVYFGKVIGVETEHSDNSSKGGTVYITVKANVRHRRGEGYSIGDSRLAVGSSLKLRCLERNINGTVVELLVGGN